MNSKFVRILSVIVAVVCLISVVTCTVSALSYSNVTKATGFTVLVTSNNILLGKTAKLVIKNNISSENAIYVTPIKIDSKCTITAGTGAGVIGLTKRITILPGNSATVYISIARLSSGCVTFKVECASGGPYSYSFDASGSGFNMLGKCNI